MIGGIIGFFIGGIFGFIMFALLSAGKDGDEQ